MGGSTVSHYGYWLSVCHFSEKKLLADTDAILMGKLVSVACEQQKFLLAHRAKRPSAAMSEEKCLLFAGYYFRDPVINSDPPSEQFQPLLSL